MPRFMHLSVGAPIFLVIGALILVAASLFAGSIGAVAAGSVGGPDQPGPDRHMRAQPHSPVVAAPLLASVTCDGAFHTVASQNPSPVQGNVLSGTAAISASDVWSVGAWTSVAPDDSTLAEHWDGNTWNVVSTPNPVAGGLNALFAVAAVSSSDVWAVGATGGKNTGDTTIAEHWNGSAWSVVMTPAFPIGESVDLFAVTAIASNDVWAVGQHSASSKNNTLVEHWDGSFWTVVPSPNAGTSNNQLFGVSAFGAADAWAVGYYRPFTGAARQSLAEHWNGASWAVVASVSQAGDTEMDAVAALASGTAVGVGFARSSLGAPAMPFQFGLSTGGGVGGNFPIAVPMPGTGDNDLLGVTVGASGKVWAVGWWSQLTASPAQTFVASASYTSGFLGQLMGGTSGNRTSGGLNNLLLAVTAVSPNGFWATGLDDGMFAPETLTELSCRPHLALTAAASTPNYTGFGLTVTAADLGGTTLTGYLGTVHFSSTDPQATLPADYTFVPGDSGTHSFAGLMFKAVGTETITATDTTMAEIQGSSVIHVTCLGACPGPAGTPGARGATPGSAGTPGIRPTNHSGAGTPGPRLPRLGSVPRSAETALGIAPAPPPTAAHPAAQAIAAPPAVARGIQEGTTPRQSPVIPLRKPVVMAATMVARASSLPEYNRSWLALALMPLAAASLALLWARRRNNRRPNG